MNELTVRKTHSVIPESAKSAFNVGPICKADEDIDLLLELQTRGDCGLGGPW